MSTDDAQFIRPPKPAPVPFFAGPPVGDHCTSSERDRDGSSSRTMNDDSELRASVASECSRQSLRRDLQRLRGSLTSPEINFLEDLIIEGNEIEVQLAHENLLKFDIGTLLGEEDEGGGSVGWSSQVIRVGNERSGGSLNLEDLSESEDGREVSHTGSNVSGTSDRRLEALETRRKNLLFGKMWKAHQSGLAVSKTSSRRSIFARQSGIQGLNSSIGSSASRSRRELFQRGRNADIFRSTPGRNFARNPRSSSRNNLMGDVQSDNFRRKSIASTREFKAPRHAKSSSLILEPGTSATLAEEAPPRARALRRMSSEGGRKSVTFGSLPLLPRRSIGLLEDSTSSVAEFDSKLAPARSESMSSIPSIHHGHPIRSQSVSSHSSIPSLHIAHPVRSQSFRSSGNSSAISSLGENDDPLDGDEKKAEESSPPPVVVLAPAAAESPADDVDKTPLFKNIKRPSMTSADISFDGMGIDIETTPTSPAMPKVKLSRPVLLRDASRNFYNGEGIEIADFESSVHCLGSNKEHSDLPVQTARRLDSLVSFGEGSATENESDSIMMLLHHCETFDETMSYGRVSSIFRRTIRRSLSDDDIAGIFLGGSRFLLRESSSLREVGGKMNDDSNMISSVDSWLLMDDESEMDYYDSWKVIEDEYENGYGGGGTLPFLILGTSADDVDSHPHVLSPPLMESLQAFLPQGNAGDSYWMKFSLVRDGASLYTFLQHARGAKNTFLAIETTDGEVFGSFTTEPWRKNWNFFGGSQSFLWRMRHSRKDKCHSIIDQAHKESEIDVFPYTGVNNNVQLCNSDKIAVGGGDAIPSSQLQMPVLDSPVKDHEWGFGLTLDADLLTGTTSPCITFSSPSLSKVHKDGSVFEVINVELWTLTPCGTEEEAEKLELGKLFLETHLNSNHKLF